MFSRIHNLSPSFAGRGVGSLIQSHQNQHLVSKLTEEAYIFRNVCVTENSLWRVILVISSICQNNKLLSWNEIQGLNLIKLRVESNHLIKLYSRISLELNTSKFGFCLDAAYNSVLELESKEIPYL